MNNLSPRSPLSPLNDSNGSSTNMQNNVFPGGNDAQSQNPFLLVGVRPHHPNQPSESSRPTFANALKLGLGSSSGAFQPPPEPEPCVQYGAPEPPRVLLKGDSSKPSDHSTPPTISLPEKGPAPSIVELSACCLLGKIWGEAVTLSAIIHRTRNDWKFTKWQIDYIDLGNDCVLIRFANSQDKGLVYDQRPWYVNGLNLVLIPWVPFFDPFSVQITRVDQWIRIPRLP